METPATGHTPLSRTVLPLLAAAVLVGLIFLLPERTGSAPATLDLLGLPPLALDEPPDWASQHGDDAVLRELDRLAWGGHAALTATRRALGSARGTLAPELLRRLAALGEGDPVLAEKLVAVLGDEDESTPGVVAELVHRARSEHPLPVKAALRALARVHDRAALDGILPRLLDADLEIRSHARGALAERARSGDPEAQSVILAELAGQPSDPDLAYLAVLKDFSDKQAVTPVLRAMAASAGGGAQLVALTTLLEQGDPQGAAAFDAMLAGSDPGTRINAWRALDVARKVAGQARWRELTATVDRVELLAMAQVMVVAVDTDHPDKSLALEVLLDLASDRTNSVHDDIIGALYARQHPWAEEITREELRTLVGAPLGSSVDRIISTNRCPPGFAEIALNRLADPALRDEERLLLCRLLAHVAPEQGADAVVRVALDAVGRDAAAAQDVLVLLPRLGAPGVVRLQQELGTPLGVDLFLRNAADSGLPETLPGLRQIALDRALPERERLFALDCLARLSGGPREEVLREVVKAWPDPAVKARARLIFWNYL